MSNECQKDKSSILSFCYPFAFYPSAILLRPIHPQPFCRNLPYLLWDFTSGYFTASCSLNIVFFEDFKIFRTLAFPVFPRCQCVYTLQAGSTPALQQNGQSSEKSQNFKEKAQYLINTLYILQSLIM